VPAVTSKTAHTGNVPMAFQVKQLVK
jgi:hypothetical protein